MSKKVKDPNHEGIAERPKIQTEVIVAGPERLSAEEVGKAVQFEVIIKDPDIQAE